MAIDDEFMIAATSIADERYGGSLPRGFAHLALQLAYPPYEFMDQQAEDVTSIDRRGDLGADGLHIDEDEHRILLFQAKSSPSLKETELHKEISAFINVPTKLLSDEWVAKAHSEMKSLANDFRRAVREGYEIVYAFVTASRITPAIRSTFSDLNLVPGTTIPASMMLLDAPSLGDRYRKLLLSETGAPTNVRFAVSKDQMHQPLSQERVVYLTLPAREYVNACREHGMELFRYNPRLYLGINKVNSGIATTLKSELERHYFHLLNNGITAVCSHFELVDAGGSDSVLRADDFQVVNGCQTTMTLLSNSEDFAGDDKCLVDIKIIESPGLRARISQTTNTQTSILAEDSFANAPEQKQIQEQLMRYSPPYFYAQKRGAWEQQKAPQKRQYQDTAPRARYRKLTSKELAAVCLAVFGEPESAKDKPRIVFDKVGGTNSTYYDRIFANSNVAAQWLLPFELLQYSNAAVKEEAAKAKEACGDEPDCPDAERARIGAYGRFRMIHLAYAYLKRTVGEAGDFIAALESERLLQSASEWAPALLQIALDAIVDSYREAKERGESSGLREFFREKKHQRLVLQRFDDELSRNERLAKRNRRSLPEQLGLIA